MMAQDSSAAFPLESGSLWGSSESPAVPQSPFCPMPGAHRPHGHSLGSPRPAARAVVPAPPSDRGWNPPPRVRRLQKKTCN